MFLASRGHKQAFVAKRWLVSLQTSPCSCSPLLAISMCVRASVCGYMWIYVGQCVCLCVSVFTDTCVCVCVVQYILQSLKCFFFHFRNMDLWTSQTPHLVSHQTAEQEAACLISSSAAHHCFGLYFFPLIHLNCGETAIRLTGGSLLSNTECDRRIKDSLRELWPQPAQSHVLCWQLSVERTRMWPRDFWVVTSSERKRAMNDGCFGALMIF